jgi:hypothetical protein
MAALQREIKKLIANGFTVEVESMITRVISGITDTSVPVVTDSDH